jgi:hypothetical protein
MELFGFAFLGFCLAFLGILALVVVSVMLLGRFLQSSSGFECLAKRFPTGECPSGLSGNSFTWHTIRAGGVRYRNASVIIASTDGLYLRIHAPLQRPAATLIPWDEIHEVGTTIIYMRKAIAFSIGSPEIARICLFEDVYNAIQEYRRKP